MVIAIEAIPKDYQLLSVFFKYGMGPFNLLH